MANRRLARGGRATHKKKLKIAKKQSSGSATRSVARRLEVLAKGASPRAYLAGSGASAIKLQSKCKRATKRDAQRRSDSSRDGAAPVITRRMQALMKDRAALRKQQQAEKMALKEHIRELDRRRESTRKGDGAKQERRELAKYVRQLKEEQLAKHASELASVEAELQRLTNASAHSQPGSGGSNEEVHVVAAADAANDDDWEDVPQIDSDDSVDEEALQNMFSSLLL